MAFKKGIHYGICEELQQISTKKELEEKVAKANQILRETTTQLQKETEALAKRTSALDLSYQDSVLANRMRLIQKDRRADVKEEIDKEEEPEKEDEMSDSESGDKFTKLQKEIEKLTRRIDVFEQSSNMNRLKDSAVRVLRTEEDGFRMELLVKGNSATLLFVGGCLGCIAIGIMLSRF